MNATNLTSFKRELKPGMRLRVIAHWQPRYQGTVRTVVKVQTNAYWFTNDSDPERHISRYPSANQVQFADGQVVFHLDDHRSWTLEEVF